MIINKNYSSGYPLHFEEYLRYFYGNGLNPDDHFNVEVVNKILQWNILLTNQCMGNIFEENN